MSVIKFKQLSAEEYFLLFIKVFRFVAPVSGVGVCSTVCLFLAGIYYCYLLPYQWSNYSFIFLLLNFTIAHWIQLNMLYNYIMSIIIHPGRSKGAGPSTCRTCRKNRPERSHHCRQCGFCVLLMDHHCLWINNCVGLYNYGYFLRAALYVWLGAVYGTMALSPEAIAYTHNTSVMFGDADLPNLCLAAFILCVAVAVAFSILNMWYFSLAKDGMTSIEYKQLKAWKGTISPYDRGFRQNVEFAYGIKLKAWHRILHPTYYLPYVYWNPGPFDGVSTSC